VKVELSLAVSLALLLIPLSFTDDIVNPNPYTLVYSGHGSGVFPLLGLGSGTRSAAAACSSTSTTRSASSSGFLAAT